MKHIEIKDCPSCHQKLEVGLTFLGFHKLKCTSCGEAVLPLKPGFRVGYWFFLIIGILTAIAEMQANGGFAVPGLLGILAIYALAKDWKLRREYGNTFGK